MNIETPFSATFPNSKLRYAAEGVSAAVGAKPLEAGGDGEEEMAKLAYACGYHAGMQDLYKYGSGVLQALPKLHLPDIANLTSPKLIHKNMFRFREAFQEFDPVHRKREIERALEKLLQAHPNLRTLSHRGGFGAVLGGLIGSGL